MPLARPASEPQFLSLSDGAADQEFARVLRTADPGPAVEGPLTFLPAGAWAAAWQAWREQTFLPILAPALLQTAAHAVRGGAREILALDREFGAALPAAASVRSRAAGRRLLARLSTSRGERCLGKLQQWAVAGEMPAHFPTIHAVQHALFHLPVRLLIPAYAYWEWSAAGGKLLAFADEADDLCRFAHDFLAAHAAAAHAH